MRTIKVIIVASISALVAVMILKMGLAIEVSTFLIWMLGYLTGIIVTLIE